MAKLNNASAIALLLLCFFFVSPALAGKKPPPGSKSPAHPHIVMILSDDFGWADAGWHRPGNYAEVSTPRMTELVKEGIEASKAVFDPL